MPKSHWTDEIAARGNPDTGILHQCGEEMKIYPAIVKTIWVSNTFERLHKRTHRQVSQANTLPVVFRHSPIQDPQHQAPKSCLVGQSQNWKGQPNLRPKPPNSANRNHWNAGTTRKGAPANWNRGHRNFRRWKTKGMWHVLKDIPEMLYIGWLMVSHPFRDRTTNNIFHM